ncbi:nudix hydrolase 19, chloroplastic isoform X2 [Mercurialis annua]|uniref:nudix hydrolase 19, chloroplastic isoform X2 n=1 Tax=Mercurialis annua TaxID=3986 RepID=UPI00215DFA5C|nr:nudix hydrolase 19, chloroplastic isoform X2 [Mercurialis annua]
MFTLLFASSSSPTSTLLTSLSKKLYFKNPIFTRTFSCFTSTRTSMAINLQTHAFAGNPLLSKTLKPTDPLSPNLALESLKTQLLDSNTHQLSSVHFKVLPFRKGKPLASSSSGSDDGNDDLVPNWHLGWISLSDCRTLLANSGVELSGESLVYLGSKSDEDVVYWAVDVSGEGSLVTVFGSKQFCFVEMRTLMVATDWANESAMGDLSIAGHARALLEWHKISNFCGHCGGKTVPMEAGRRKQCSNEVCKKRIYPRVDPVVIMLVIDKENDRVLLSRQSRYVPRMWSCLAGFIEPGESLEEAVRRETWEETGIEVGEVVYHSSQPWPDAKWHSREDVQKALTYAEYEKAQRTAAAKVDQMCKGVEKGQNLSADFNVESGELAPMFFPGPFAIAHHLISSWVNHSSTIGVELDSKRSTGSMSNL